MRSHRLDNVVSAQVMDHLIRRECARSDRNGQIFSLVLFRVPGNGKRRRSLAAHRLARVMLKRVRLTDEVGWVGEQHLGALLTDTSAQGAQFFVDGVCQILARKEMRPLAMVYAYPRDKAVGADAPGFGRLTGVQTSAAENLVAANGYANGHSHDNGNGHAHYHASGNGHSHANGHSNGPSHLNANGHNDRASAYLNGNGNGHSHNGNGHGAAATLVNGENGSRTMSIKLGAARKTDVKPITKEALPVSGVEELLAFPMPRWKRLIDILSAVTLMVLFAPLMAIAALAIKFSSPGPVIYTQNRSGLGGKPFRIYKFRTMIVGAEKQQQELRKFNEQDGPAFKLTRDPRVTRIGHFLRKSSIDELPQLLNILRGEMSLVGPRPLPIAEQEGCEQWQRHRLNVTPGITCIWQVKGRSTVTFAEWVRMDVEYIRRRTIVHDLAIIFSTIPSVLLRKGAR